MTDDESLAISLEEQLELIEVRDVMDEEWLMFRLDHGLDVGGVE